MRTALTVVGFWMLPALLFAVVVAAVCLWQELDARRRVNARLREDREVAMLDRIWYAPAFRSRTRS